MNADERAKAVAAFRMDLEHRDTPFAGRVRAEWGLALDAQLTAAEKERDEAIDSRATLRSAWNHHADNCEQFKTPLNLPPPTLDDIREWMTAPSATASALGPEHTVSYWRQRAVAAEKERDEWRDLAVPAEASPQWAALEERASRAEKENQRLEAMLDQLRTFNQSPTAALLAEENQRLREVLIRLGQFARREIDAALSQDTSC